MLVSDTMRARLLLILALLLPHAAHAYSVETHEQLIDLTWRASIVPLLRARFPGITPAQLQQAHAYAYGGSVIQDIGYYPFGNALFSDLTHYVRSGDFVNSLLHNARTPDELAFAVGALSHYLGDTIGHVQATNPSVAVELPKLAEKLQTDSINYEQNPHAHVQTEFAFDINEISKHRFAPLKYLEHVFAESMRLYPPAWVVARTAKHDYTLRDGQRIPRGAHLIASQLVVHHDPRWWPDPERFDPARFTDEVKATRPKFAYFPFGGGARFCIGEGFAWMEGVLMLAAVVQQWTLRLPDPAAETLPITPKFTIRPADPVALLAEPLAPAASRSPARMAAQSQCR